MSDGLPQLDAPMSASELAMRRQIEDVSNRNRLILQIVGLCLLPTVGVCLMIAGWKPSSDQCLAGGSITLVLGFFLGIGMTLEFEAPRDDYKALAEHQCTEMLALCHQVEGGMAWRDTVIAQAREFTAFDMAVLRACKERQDEWQSRAGDRAACRKLYGIEEISATCAEKLAG
ncbi:hypothetical protein [Paraburkholderia sp. J8-2]|uniref:hypothetical protein n=1 Tax=Paraburkholderia sp. J8-2 TaxID=2805440 RepID=UPI002AB75195|nr:hypothetical protein [Paraburkholderia sp. J8-2]